MVAGGAQAAVDPLAVRLGVPVRPVRRGGRAVALGRLAVDTADEAGYPGHEGVAEPGLLQRRQAAGGTARVAADRDPAVERAAVDDDGHAAAMRAAAGTRAGRRGD